MITVSALAGVLLGAVATKTTNSSVRGPPEQPLVAVLSDPIDPIAEKSTAVIDLTAGPQQQLAFLNSIQGLDTDGCVELFENYANQSILVGTNKQRAFEALFTRWSAINPERAMEAALSLPEVNGMGRSLIDIAIGGWAKAAANDPEVLAKSLPHIQALQYPARKISFVKGLHANVEAPNFNDAFAKARSLLDSMPHMLVLEVDISGDDDVFEAILERRYQPIGAIDDPNPSPYNPLQVYKFATDNVSDSKNRWKGQSTAMLQLAQLDPERAAKALEEIDSFVRRIGSNYFLHDLAANPQTAELALNYISELPTAWDRTMKYRHLGTTLARQGPVDGETLAKAIELAKPFEREEMMAGMTGVMPPDIAKEVIGSLDGRTHRLRAIENAVQAASDWQEGLKFTESLETPTDRMAARDHLVANLSKIQTADAAQVAFAAEYPRERVRHLDHIADHILQRRSTGGTPIDLTWIGELEGDQRNEFEAVVLKHAKSEGLGLPEVLVEAFK